LGHRAIWRSVGVYDKWTPNDLPTALPAAFRTPLVPATAMRPIASPRGQGVAHEEVNMGLQEAARAELEDRK